MSGALRNLPTPKSLDYASQQIRADAYRIASRDKGNSAMDRDSTDGPARESHPHDEPVRPRPFTPGGAGAARPAADAPGADLLAYRREGAAAVPAPGKAARPGPDAPAAAPTAAAGEARTPRIPAEHSIRADPPRLAPVRVHWGAPPAAVMAPSVAVIAEPATATETASPAAEPPAPGLSVAQAATTSRIAFRPLRAASVEPDHRTEYRPREPTPPLERVRPIDLRRRFEPGFPPEPTTRGLQEPAPEQPRGVQRFSARRTSDDRRFARTAAELERCRLAAPRSDPWTDVVPSAPPGPHHDEPPDEPNRGDRPSALRLLWRYMRRRETDSEPSD